MQSGFSRVAALVIVPVIGGCATDGAFRPIPYDRKICAAIGAVGGGGLGAIDSTEGALIGAVAGGVIGYFVCGNGADADKDGVPNAKDACPSTPSGAIVDARGCEPDADKDGVSDARDECPATPAGSKVDARGCELDSDGDGVLDRMDHCPGTAPGTSVDSAGCPSVVDNDGDGVPDTLDRCPNTPAGVRVNSAGCEGDADNDGVPDSQDRCPDTPPSAQVDPRGCLLDADGDGVPDARDRCPGTPAGTIVDADGCVRVTDRDGDGVADAEDRCPDTPAGTRVDTAGCPLPKTVVLKGVNFETGSARLTANSARTLDNVVETLHSNPDLKVEIGGHTDSTGSAALNRHLSKQRAEAVRVYLVSKGANAESLTAVGYGPDKPLAENATPEGRAANRRVELKILNP